MDLNAVVLTPGPVGAALYWATIVLGIGYSMLGLWRNGPLLLILVIPPLVGVCSGMHARDRNVRFELRMTTLLSTWLVTYSILFATHYALYLITWKSSCILRRGKCVSLPTWEQRHMSNMTSCTPWYWSFVSWCVLSVLSTPGLLWVWHRMESNAGATRATFTMLWIVLWYMVEAGW